MAVTRPAEHPALPEKPGSSSADPRNTPIDLQDAVIIDGVANYAEFKDDFDGRLTSPPHKTHYAIPFDVSDDTDQGKHHPKTVSQSRSGDFLLLCCAENLDRSLRCKCARCLTRSGRSRVGGRR
jgi:hypothetical protein